MRPIHWKDLGLIGAVALAASAVGCGDSTPARGMEVPVVADGARLVAASNDEGWGVTIAEFRLAVRDLQFTVQGEMHARQGGVLEWLASRIADAIIPRAHAHPGHNADGEITGELAGSFVIDFLRSGGTSLGKARLLEGDYNGANFAFRRAGATDALPVGDVLLGHTAAFSGTAAKDGRTIAFTARIDVDEGAQLVGAPLDYYARVEEPKTLVLQALERNPVAGRTLFDGVDFGALDPDGDGQAAIEPGTAAHNIVRRNVQVHDLYQVITR